MIQRRLFCGLRANGISLRSGSRTISRLAAGLSVVACTTALIQVAPSSAVTFPGVTTFHYTGTEQSYVVPAGITLIQIEAVGGNGSPLVNRGVGADVVAGVPVVGGETLYVEVGAYGGVSSFGGGGAGAGNGGSGGGASDVRTCSMSAVSCSNGATSLSSRLVVAGGGGGGGGGAPPSFDFGYSCGNYGGGGNGSYLQTPITTSNGTVIPGQNGSGASPAILAKGGQTTSPGAGGSTPDCSGFVASFGGSVSGSDGVGASGGAGGLSVDSPPGGGGGGGGGGYFGGGGGASGQTETAPIANHSSSLGGGGGAGSSFYSSKVTGDVSVGRGVDGAPSLVSFMPLIGITSPQEAGTYLLHSVVNATFICQPLIGGCGSATDPNNTPIDTSTLGPHTFSVTTLNATSTIHFTVVAPPTISSAILSSNVLAPSGGPVILHAHVTDASNCSLAFTPTIDPQPAPWDCSGATSSTDTPFVVPPNATSATTSTSVNFTAQATYSDGTSRAVSLALSLTTKGYQFIQTSRSVTAPTSPTSLSCPTASFCAQVGSNGYVGTITPSRVTWLRQDHSNRINAISCVAGPPIFCLAVDAVGQTLYFDGTRWSRPTPIQVGHSPNLSGVSCTQPLGRGPAGCVVVSNDLPGSPISSWGYLPALHRAISLSPLNAPASGGSEVFVSCWATPLSAKNCALLNRDGSASFWSGGPSWSTPTPIFSDGGISEHSISSLSCAFDNICLGGDTNGGSTEFTQAHPASTRQSVTLLHGPLSLTCVLDTYCLASDDQGNFYQRVAGSVPQSGSWAPISARVKVQFFWDRSCQGKFTTARPTTCTAIVVASGKESIISGQVKLSP